MSEFEEIRKKLLATKKTDHLPFDRGLSSGSTVLNLACTGRPDVAFLPGLYYHFVGDSSSGKTFLCLTAFAEAGINPKYKDHRLIFDNAENGALMDLERFFGSAVARRLEPPGGTRKDPKFSSTVEGFFRHVDDVLDDRKPFLYVLDSTDTLSTKAEIKTVRAARKADDKGEEGKGSFGTSRARDFSTRMRLMHNRLRDDGRSMVFLITQTRDNIGFGAKFDPKTYSGGNALLFYAALQVWFSQAGHIKRKVKGRPRELGIYSRVRLKKNRVTGRDRTALVPILHSHGIDDPGGSVRYLIDEGHWKTVMDKSTREVKSVEAPEFNFDGSPEKLVQLIEEQGREAELRELTAKVWGEIEEACKVERKPRYS